MSTNEGNEFLSKTLEWLEEQKNKAIKTALDNWPDDYKFISNSEIWFSKIYKAVIVSPPKKSVRRIIVKENRYGNVIGIDYEYQIETNTDRENMAFRITMLNDNAKKTRE